MKRIIIIILFLSSVSFAQTNDDINSNENIETNNQSRFLAEYYDGEDAVDPEPAELESPLAALFRIVFITAILGFLTWVVIRYVFRRNAVSLTTGGKTIEILATIPVGLGTYFVIAKLGNLYYLMSLSSEGLRLLDKITDQEAIDFIELNKEDTLPQDVKFVDLLDKMPEGKPKKALEFLRDQIDKLKQK